MTVDIVPAILAHNQEEFLERLRLVEGQVPLVQVDVLDNTFVPFESYANPDDIDALKLTFDIDVHLMTTQVEKTALRWLKPWVGKITFHVEAAQNIGAVLELIHSHKVSAALALNPETPADAVVPFLTKIESVLFLGVHPGRSGQEFKMDVLEKIRAFHEASPETVIGIDGGMTRELIPRLIAAGASTICVGSLLFNAADVAEELRELEKIAEEKGG